MNEQDEFQFRHRFEQEQSLGVGGGEEVKPKSWLMSLAEKASAVVNPPTPMPKGNIFKRLYGAIKEQYAPTPEAMKRAITPQLGQFGLSRMAQQGGEKLKTAVSSVSPTIGELAPSLTPRTVGEQIGAIPITEMAIPSVVSAASKAIGGPLQQLLTGIPAKEWFRLSGNLKSLRPSFLGGAPSKAVAGEALKGAEEAAGMFKSSLPSGMNREYAQKFIDTLKDFTASGKERGLTARELADPKIADKLVKELTPQEIFDLRQAVTNTLDEWVPGKRSTEYYQFSALKEALNKQIESLSPLLRKAQSVYADAAQRSKFLSLFPRTKYGEPALGRLGFTAMASGLAGVSGWGDPAEMAKRAASVLVMTSPISNAAARTAGTLAARTAPVVGRGLLEILKRSRENNK